jgi:hypothetical protein
MQKETMVVKVVFGSGILPPLCLGGVNTKIAIWFKKLWCNTA